MCLCVMMDYVKNVLKRDLWNKCIKLPTLLDLVYALEMCGICIRFELDYEQGLVMMNAWKEIDTQEWKDDEEALDPRTCRCWFEV